MRNLFIGASPNIQRDDIWLIIKQIFQPWKWKNEEGVFNFESQIEKYLNTRSENDPDYFRAVAFDSARSSLALLLKEYGIGQGDEVVVPSFTCVVVINSVLKVGAIPVYIDSDLATFNIDLKELERKINSKTKAIIVQHTFGVAVDIPEVRKIVGNKVKIIEDVAHILGGEDAEGRKYGTLGDASVLTFGIEKMMTTLRGGMVLVKDETVYTKLKEAQKVAPSYSRKRILVWLLNPLIWAIAAPLYFIGLGKYTMGRMISQVGHTLGLMGNMMEPCEYKGKWPAWLPSKLPGVFAVVGNNQLSKLDQYNQHRREVALIYDNLLGLHYHKYEGYTPLRYPVLVSDPETVFKKLRQSHVIAGNWYRTFLFTKEEFLKYLYFEPSEYPITQNITNHVINLPVFIKVHPEQAERIAEIVKPYLIQDL